MTQSKHLILRANSGPIHLAQQATAVHYLRRPPPSCGIDEEHVDRLLLLRVRHERGECSNYNDEDEA